MNGTTTRARPAHDRGRGRLPGSATSTEPNALRYDHADETGADELRSTRR